MDDDAGDVADLRRRGGLGDDVEAAMRWAARCPGAAHGAAEVRLLMAMPASVLA
jgi:hypothetical protein